VNFGSAILTAANFAVRDSGQRRAAPDFTKALLQAHFDAAPTS
jgi:hypothetical protein